MIKLIWAMDTNWLIGKENKIPYAIDVTNYDEKYLRNMIRHQKVMKMSCFEKRKLYRLIELKNKWSCKMND